VQSAPFAGEGAVETDGGGQRRASRGRAADEEQERDGSQDDFSVSPERGDDDGAKHGHDLRVRVNGRGASRFDERLSRFRAGVRHYRKPVGRVPTPCASGSPPLSGLFDAGRRLREGQAHDLTVPAGSLT
jgi:hypothetical protein